MAYNLFISHSWSYSDAYEKLINLLDAPLISPTKIFQYQRTIQSILRLIKLFYMKR